MGICCGKSSGSQPASSASPTSSSQAPKQDNSPEPDDWGIGGKYKLLQPGTLWKSQRVGSGKICDLWPQDLVVIIQFEAANEAVSPGARWARVVPPQRGLGAGWLLLEANSSMLDKRPVKGSWEVPGRYHVRRVAVLRRELSLSSQEMLKVQPGEEVLLSELGVAQSSGEPVRVCAKVKTESGEIGWLSLENTSGVSLLDTTNLLGPGVADVHRQRLHAEMHGTGTSDLPSVKFSILSNSGDMPWEVYQSYRTLEELSLFETPETGMAESLGGPAPPVIPGGSLVQVLEIQSLQCPDLGRCPFARVGVEDGSQKGLQGWLRCSAKDGHDLIDTRNQLKHGPVPQTTKTDESNPAEPERKNVPASLSRLRGEVGSDDAVPEAFLSVTDPNVACSHCVCSLLPPERSHPTLLAVHEPAPLVEPSAALPGLEPLPNDDLERWLKLIYKRYNPSRLPQVPDLLKDFQGQERALVEKTCGKYRVSPPGTWHGKGAGMVRLRETEMVKS